MNPLLILDVVRFEINRSLTIGRIAIWVALIAFPVTLVSIVRMNMGLRPDDPGAAVLEYGSAIEQYGILLYFLIPEVICLLGLLLWSTPVVATEIEGQTWIYLAMRQSGRSIVLLGKYLTSVAWTLSAALIGITLCVWIIGAPDSLEMWLMMSGLATLSCLAHSAIFLLIGVIFHRRTMVTAVVYTLVFEYGLSLIPAIANKLTVNYRLRGLLANWMEWDSVRSRAEVLFGSETSTAHLNSLAVFTIVLLVLSVLRLSRAEYPTQQDG